MVLCSEGKHTEFSLQLQVQGLEGVESWQSLRLMVELGLDNEVCSPVEGFLDMLCSDTGDLACQSSWPLFSASLVPSGLLQICAVFDSSAAGHLGTSKRTNLVSLVEAGISDGTKFPAHSSALGKLWGRRLGREEMRARYSISTGAQGWGFGVQHGLESASTFG